MGLALLINLVGGGAEAALAGEPGPRIEISNCWGEIVKGLAASVTLEIDVLLREQGRPGTPPQLVTIRCDDTRALIAVTTAGARREASVDLGGLAIEHRARAVALAAAELVQAWLDAPVPEMAPARPARPSALGPVTAPPTAATSSAPSARVAPELLVAGLAEWLGQPAALLLGARVSFRYPLGPVIVPALSVDGALGSVDVPSAEVAAETIAAGLHVYAGKTSGPYRFEAGPGARGGWIHLSGRPTAAETALEGRVLGAAWGGPEVRARAAYRGADRHSPIVAIELGAGFVVLPVRGLRDGGQRVYAVEGPWISLGLALGLVL